MPGDLAEACSVARLPDPNGAVFAARCADQAIDGPLVAVDFMQGTPVSGAPEAYPPIGLAGEADFAIGGSARLQTGPPAGGIVCNKVPSPARQMHTVPSA